MIKITDENDLYQWQELYIERIVDQQKDDKTVDNYNRVLTCFIEYTKDRKIIDLSDIDTSLIQSYLKFRDDQHAEKLKQQKSKKEISDLSKNTKLNEIKAIRIFTGFIADESYEKRDLKTIDFPYLKYERIKLKSQRKQRKEYDPETIVEFLKYLQKRIASGRTYFDYSISLAFKLCLFGGLRATESCTIRLQDFSKKRKTKDGEVKIDVTIRGKGNTLFSVPINYEHIKKEISFFNRKVKNDNEQIFKTRTGKDFTRHTFYRDMEKVAAELSIKNKALHALRHTLAAILNNQGVDISVIQVILRHTSISTTQIYTGVSTSRVDEATGKISI